MSKRLYNHPIFKERRQTLRKESTDAENTLWQKLRNKQLDGLKFFRQYSVGPYILDFYCPKIRLAIESDGSQHAENQEYDQERTDYLFSHDINVVRFWNNEVLNNLEGVLEKICEESDHHPSQPPLTLRGGTRVPPLKVRGGWGEL